MNLWTDTEIDWSTYMQQVECFLNGTLDYTAISGDTGPIVYPAGHLYIYTLFYFLTNRGTNIFLAQHIFICLYLANLFVVFRIYRKYSKVSKAIQCWLLCILSCNFGFSSGSTIYIDIYVLHFLSSSFSLRTTVIQRFNRYLFSLFSITFDIREKMDFRFNILLVSVNCPILCHNFLITLLLVWLCQWRWTYCSLHLLCF